jgi:hypothetical protein
MKHYQVPENQRVDYLKTLEQAYRYAQQIEPKLPMYYYVLRDTDMLRKLVAIIFTTREQRSLVSNTNHPKYILPFTTLSTLVAQVQNVNAQFNAVVSAYRQQAPNIHHPGNGQPPSNGSQQRPPIPQGPQHIQPTPSISAQSVPPLSDSRPINLHQPLPSKKKPQQPQVNAVLTAAAASSPTPPASTLAAVATPAAASTKTPKSSKGKAPAKHIKTEEDASAFLEQMSELIKLTAGNDQESLTSDISEALHMWGQDSGDVYGASSWMAPLGFGDTLGLQDPSLPPHADEFEDFLDFTQCTAGDVDSMPTTPDVMYPEAAHAALVAALAGFETNISPLHSPAQWLEANRDAIDITIQNATCLNEKDRDHCLSVLRSTKVYCRFSVFAFVHRRICRGEDG